MHDPDAYSSAPDTSDGRDQVDVELPADDDTTPAPGELCERHFSWLCQAGQGECQREQRGG